MIELVDDISTSSLVFVHNVTITNTTSRTVYKYQRSASRLLNAQAYANMAPKLLKMVMNIVIY